MGHKTVSILVAKNITKKYAKFTALLKISLEVKEGEIRSIIGPNGAGKTTFLNVVTGKVKASEGAVYYYEKEITGKEPYEIVRYGIARTFQIVNIFPDLTVLENIIMPVLTKAGKNMKLFSPPQVHVEIVEKSLEVLERVGLQMEKTTLAGRLSHGDKRKLDIGIGLAQEPKLFLLDEPLAGLNAQEKDSIVKLIVEIAEERHLTIILVEHDMNAVFAISDSITVFQHGIVIAQGKPEEIRKDKAVIRAYLGE